MAGPTLTGVSNISLVNYFGDKKKMLKMVNCVPFQQFFCSFLNEVHNRKPFLGLS